MKRVFSDFRFSVFEEGLKRRLMAETAGESILLGAFETDAHGLASGFRISAE